MFTPPTKLCVHKLVAGYSSITSNHQFGLLCLRMSFFVNFDLLGLLLTYRSFCSINKCRGIYIYCKTV